MEYYHWSAQPVAKLYAVEPANQQGLMKPKGLWLSEGSAWIDWCQAEGFATCDFETAHTYKATINTERLAIIDSYEALEAFVKKFYDAKKTVCWESVNWKKVAELYDGIVFQNFEDIRAIVRNKDEFVKYIWFCCTDISCACIWQPTAITSFEEVKKVEYYHYSVQPIKEIATIEPTKQPVGKKPKGLWLSEGTKWFDWCEKNTSHFKEICHPNGTTLADLCWNSGNAMSDLKNAYTYKAALSRSNLAMINSYETLQEFNKKFCGEGGIHWKKVAELYDGIVFQNYEDVRAKLKEDEYIWFFALDISCACIWQPTAITSFEEVKI